MISLMWLTKYLNYIASRIYQIKPLLELYCLVTKDLLITRIDSIHSHIRAFFIGSVISDWVNLSFLSHHPLYYFITITYT